MLKKKLKITTGKLMGLMKKYKDDLLLIIAVIVRVAMMVMM